MKLASEQAMKMLKEFESKMEDTHFQADEGF